ncbi:hypothetical protein ABWW58_05900 [Sporolactobacillus sp. STCC-11]|uniref:hypothetical protein n=1 Tax=Sporolactobacillus caesalpiniae TaxID=3230362 RepID=UPI0033981591
MPYKLPLANDWDPVFDSNRQNSLNDHFLQQTMYLMRSAKCGRSRATKYYITWCSGRTQMNDER